MQFFYAFIIPHFNPFCIIFCVILQKNDRRLTFVCGLTAISSGFLFYKIYFSFRNVLKFCFLQWLLRRNEVQHQQQYKLIQPE